ncbi:MAG: ABC transporter permease [Clostridia bacterium]|nr:ABC transporter permease [Clostridia bacterium]
MFETILSFLPRAVSQGIPLLYGSTGEIITQKSGNMNLGIPGVMYVGGICGVIGAFIYEQSLPSPEAMIPFLAVLIPTLFCLLGSLLMGALFCFLTVTLRANQNVTGLAMTTFGVGFGNFFGGSLVKLSGADMPYMSLSATSNCFKKTLPLAEILDAWGDGIDAKLNALGAFGDKLGNFCDFTLGAFGDLVLDYSFLVYLSIAIALIAAFVINRTRTGLHLRAVGENPATADSAGINVNNYKYSATCLGCMVAGLGGLYYVMDYAGGIWANNAFGDRGWLAIALVIFTIWRTNLVVLASFLFGGLYILHMYIPSGMNLAVKELYKMLPYVVTIIVLIISSLRNQRDKQPPAALGLPYFREDR